MISFFIFFEVECFCFVFLLFESVLVGEICGLLLEGEIRFRKWFCREVDFFFFFIKFGILLGGIISFII